MNLNEVLWSKLDLTEFGDMSGVTLYDEPEVVSDDDDYNPLSYGNTILFHKDNSNDMYVIAHASKKNLKACSIVSDIYFNFHKQIDSLACIESILCRTDPALCGELFQDDIKKLFGSELKA